MTAYPRSTSFPEQFLSASRHCVSWNPFKASSLPDLTNCQSIIMRHSTDWGSCVPNQTKTTRDRVPPGVRPCSAPSGSSLHGWTDKRCTRHRHTPTRTFEHRSTNESRSQSTIRRSPVPGQPDSNADGAVARQHAVEPDPFHPPDLLRKAGGFSTGEIPRTRTFHVSIAGAKTRSKPDKGARRRSISTQRTSPPSGITP